VFLIVQEGLADGLRLDPLPFTQNGCVAGKVDVDRCDVVQALVVVLVVVLSGSVRARIPSVPRLQNADLSPLASSLVERCRLTTAAYRRPQVP
jgi:hypothetical protein